MTRECLVRIAERRKELRCRERELEAELEGIRQELSRLAGVVYMPWALLHGVSCPGIDDCQHAGDAGGGGGA